MQLLKICVGTWANASRDKRELSVCAELGMAIEIMAKGEVTGVKETIDGYLVNRFSTRPWKHLSAGINRFVAVFTWAHYARQFHADIISGHDLIALTIGYLSNLFQPKAKKARLVYDSHEFELGRNAKRNKLTLFCIKLLEGFLMRRCAFSIMVNDSIADEVQRIHKLKTRPIVVRNIPNYWELDDTSVMQKRTELCAALNVPKYTFLLLYHGALFNNRGIEKILRAVAQTEGTAAIVLGNGEPTYIASLQALCGQLNILSRVLFLPAVPLSRLFSYIAAADVEILIGAPDVRSYYLSLPNKFFESIQAETPVIVGGPETGKLTSAYGIGCIVDPSNDSYLINAIEKLRVNKSYYNTCKKNLKKAKQELCWENEKDRLKKAYSELTRSLSAEA